MSTTMHEAVVDSRRNDKKGTVSIHLLPAERGLKFQVTAFHIIQALIVIPLAESMLEKIWNTYESCRR